MRVGNSTFARWMRDPTAGSKFGMSWAVVPALRGLDKSLEGIAGSALKPGGLFDKHEGAHEGGHGQAGSYTDEKAKTIEGIAGVEYELRGDSKAKAAAWSGWIQSGFANGNVVGAQKAFEAKSREEQSEILAQVKDMEEGGQLKEGGYQALLDRLSTEEKDEVEKIIETRPLTFQTTKLKDLQAIKDNKVKGKNYNASDRAAAEAKMREFANNLTTDQFIDLEPGLILDDAILEQANTLTYEQFQRKNKLSKKNRDEVAKKLRAKIQGFATNMKANMAAALAEGKSNKEYLDEMSTWHNYMDGNGTKWWGGRDETEDLAKAIQANGGTTKGGKAPKEESKSSAPEYEASDGAY